MTGPILRRPGIVDSSICAVESLAAALCVGELAGDVSPCIAVGDVPPSIVELLAARQRELDLRPAPLRDIQAKRDDRLTLGLGPAQELIDLGTMEEKLAHPLRLVVVAIAALEGRDVCADEPGLTVLDSGIGVGEVGLARAERLDLRPGQDDAGLERLVDGEVVAGSSVECDGLLVAHVGFPLETRTNAGPMRAGVRVLTHPQGVRLDGHLLRGGAATSIYHCTSPPFVLPNRTR